MDDAGTLTVQQSLKLRPIKGSTRRASARGGALMIVSRVCASAPIQEGFLLEFRHRDCNFALDGPADIQLLTYST